MKKVISILGHLLALGLILAFFFPIAKSYYQSIPAIGADFLQFTSYVAFIRDHLSLPPASWKYTWYSGTPLVFDYSWLHFYLTLPFTAFLTVINASRLYLVIAMFAHLVFSYLLLHELCKNRFVSALLTISLASSINFYHGLFDGGTATFTATRMFLPLALYLLVKYFHSQQRAYLLLAGLVMGLSSLGHTGSLFLIMLGPTLLFYISWRDEKTPLINFSKIKGGITLIIVSLLVGGVTLYPIIDQILHRPGYSQFGANTKVQSDALIGLIDRTNPILIILFIVFLGLVILRKKVRKSLEAQGFFMLVFYVVFSGVLYIIGHHPLSQAMGPQRIWWIFSLGLAGMIAVFWHQLFPQQEGKLLVKKNIPFFLSLLFFVPLFLSFNVPDLPIFGSSFAYKMFKNTSKVGYPAAIQSAVISDDRKTIKEVMIPSWMDTQSLDYRIYETIGDVETWWSSIFPMPQVRGYYDNMNAKAMDWLYWIDNTILGEYVWHFNIPESITKQHALFLIDWYAIRYLEIGPVVLPKYLADDPNIIEAKIVTGTTKEPLRPFKIAEQVTSPIIRPSNSPAMLVVGNVVAYDTLLKLLATENLNSRYMVPIHGPEYLEDLALWNLSDFDAIFLYNYKYHNASDFRLRPQKPWDKLEKYVKNGGKLIIETGGEVIESNSSILSDRKLDKLPNVFPIDVTKREALGDSWDLEVEDSPITKGVEFDKFAKLLYENTIWNFSYATDIRPWAKVILSQKGKPILAEGQLGSGKVIWSGMNLPYHFIYYLNLSEAVLFRNVLGELVGINREEDIKTAIVSRSSPEKIDVSGTGFSGIIFKETYDTGWKANLQKPQNMSMKVYRAGPYFMYARIPKGTQGEVKAEIVYKGRLIAWILFFVSVATIVLVMIYIFSAKTFSGIRHIITTPFKGKMSRWWEKEEEQ